MSARALLDTNVLIYCYDRADAFKQAQALEIAKALASEQAGAISTQVLAEFLVNVMRKIADPLSPEEAEREVLHHMQTWTVLPVTDAVIREAIRGVRQHQLSYWDAQIWAAAFLNRIPLVLSEDFREGAMLDGVRFLNPLRSGFRLPMLT